jgi:hypothetical protein
VLSSGSSEYLALLESTAGRYNKTVLSDVSTRANSYRVILYVWRTL